jgi:hypothetical protein
VDGRATNEIQEIVTARERVRSGAPIPRERVRAWMESGDIEVCRAVHSCLLEEPYSSCIEPLLDFDEYQRFLMRYYERCLREDPGGESDCGISGRTGTRSSSSGRRGSRSSIDKAMNPSEPASSPRLSSTCSSTAG